MYEGISWEQYCATLPGPVKSSHECMTDTYPAGADWQKLRTEFQAVCDQLKRDGERTSGHAVIELTIGTKDAIYTCKFGVRHVSHD